MPTLAAEQLLGPPHAWPQPPQFLSSVERSTQLEPQQTAAGRERSQAFAWQSTSAQSAFPSQSLSAPSPQLCSVGSVGVHVHTVETQMRLTPHESPSQPVSAQSASPSQSLSKPSPQLDSLLCAAPPLPEQLHAAPSQVSPWGPQETLRHWGSAQSVSPSQLLSSRSTQFSWAALQPASAPSPASTGGKSPSATHSSIRQTNPGPHSASFMQTKRSPSTMGAQVQPTELATTTANAHLKRRLPRRRPPRGPPAASCSAPKSRGPLLRLLEALRR